MRQHLHRAPHLTRWRALGTGPGTFGGVTLGPATTTPAVDQGLNFNIVTDNAGNPLLASPLDTATIQAVSDLIAILGRWSAKVGFAAPDPAIVLVNPEVAKASYAVAWFIMNTVPPDRPDVLAVLKEIMDDSSFQNVALHTNSLKAIFTAAYQIVSPSGPPLSTGMLLGLGALGIGIFLTFKKKR